MPERAAGGALKLAAGLALAEASCLVAFAVVGLWALDSTTSALGIASSVFFLAFAAALAWSARGLVRLSNWSRGPIVLAQLIQLGLAWSFLGAGTLVAALVLALPALVVLVIVLSPSTTGALLGSRQTFD